MYIHKKYVILAHRLIAFIYIFSQVITDITDRFHVYFLNAVLLYLYFDLFSSFYSPKNSVHAVILNALYVEKVRVTVRALGIIRKCVTGHYMRLASTDNNILHMNSKYLELRDNLMLVPLSVHPSFSVCRFSSNF